MRTPAFALVALAAILSACVSPPETDPSRAVSTRVGARFDIVIGSNPTTGYRWVLVESSLGGVVRLEEKRYVPDPTFGPVMGAGGRDVWTFVAIAPGETVLVFEQYPPSSGSAPVARLEYRVAVR